MKRTKLLTVVILSLLGSFVFSTGIVQAADYWPTNGSYSVTPADDQQFTKRCTDQTITTQQYPDPLYPKGQYNSCVYQLSYGQYASSGHFRPFFGNYYRAAWSAVMVPGTNKIFARTNSYPGRLVYYDAAQGFRVASVGNGLAELGYIPRAQPTSVSLPGSTQALDLYSSVGWSLNGQWMVMLSSGGFYRYSVETGEFYKFSNPRGSWGVGQDPSFSYSITDDGRYILLNGIANYDASLVFDLDKCPSGGVFGVSANCPAVNLRDIITNTGRTVLRMASNELRAGGREVLASYVTTNNETKKAVIRLDGLQNPTGYMALGDSYSSGEGDSNEHYLSGTDGTSEYPKEKCHVSNRSYPYLLGMDENEEFHSLACSGAKTGDVLGLTQDNDGFYRGHFNQIGQDGAGYAVFADRAVEDFVPGRAAQYKFIEKYEPKNITVTIGGNDVGFADVLQDCLLGSCDTATERASKALEIRNVFDELQKTYTRLKESSPRSTLYVLSYPQFVSLDDACNPNVPLSYGERVYIREAVSYMNDVIRSAALSKGAVYVDIENALQGKELCSPQRIALAVNGIVFGEEMPNSFEIFGQESFHPNSRGHAQIAAYIRENYGSFPYINGERCSGDCSSFTPAQPAEYFGVTADTRVNQRASFIEEVGGVAMEGGAFLGDLMRIQTQGVPGMVVKVFMHSEPRQIATLIANDSGIVDAEVAVPVDTEPGYHEIHYQVEIVGSETKYYYQPLIVYSSENDKDGDGVLNADDQCSFINPAGVDTDTDGSDDACDAEITEPPRDDIAPSVTVLAGETAGDSQVYKSLTLRLSDDRNVVKYSLNNTETTVEPATVVDLTEFTTRNPVPGLKNGKNTLVVSDASGNQTTFEFQMAKQGPKQVDHLPLFNWLRNLSRACEVITMSIQSALGLALRLVMTSITSP